MKKKLLRILIPAVLSAACVFLLSGCFSMPMDMFDDGYYTSYTDSRESVSEGYFKLTIHTDKDTFMEGEAIDCWAELEYIGDADSITVYVYDDLITMEMTGEDIYYESSSGWAMGNGETLTLYKGKPVRYTLADSLPKSASVKPGRYEIDAWAYVGLSPDGMVSYNAYVSAVIDVEADTTIGKF